MRTGLENGRDSGTLRCGKRGGQREHSFFIDDDPWLTQSCVDIRSKKNSKFVTRVTYSDGD